MHYEKFADGTVKCIEDEIPFEVPEGWAWSRINTIAFVTKLAGFEYTKNIAPSLCENGIPLFKGKNVQNGTIVYEFESFIPESVSDELQRSQITKKCILTPYVGTIGNIGIHIRPGKYHLGSNVGKIELYNNTAILLEEYVASYLQSELGYQQLTKHIKATAQASISIEAIRDVYLPIPPGDEQLRMWDVLSKTLTLIDCIVNAELDISNLIKATKTKILDLAIHGRLAPQNPEDEPASVLLDRIRSEKEELIKQSKIKRDKKESIIFKGEDNSYYETIADKTECIDGIIPFDLPDGWVWCRLKSLAAPHENSFVDGPFGSNLKTDHYTENREVRIIQLNNIGEFVWKNNGIKYTTFKHAESLERCKSYSGDIVIAKMMPAGRAIIIPNIEDVYVISSDCVRLQLPEYVDKEYIMYMINSPIINEYILKEVQGIGRTRTSLGKLKELLVPLPPYNQQLYISKIIKNVFRNFDTI